MSLAVLAAAVVLSVSQAEVNCEARLTTLVQTIENELRTPRAGTLDFLDRELKSSFPLDNCDPQVSLNVARRSSLLRLAEETPTLYIVRFELGQRFAGFTIYKSGSIRLGFAGNKPFL